MPNLAKLPTARDAKPGLYGPILYVEAVNGLRHLFIPGEPTPLASYDPAVDATTVNLDAAGLDSRTVPYVNLFVAGAGLKVEKYWRTKSYRLVYSDARTKPSAATRPVRKAVPVVVEPVAKTVEPVAKTVEPTPEPEPAFVAPEPEPKAKAPVVEPAKPGSVAGIPDLVILPKVKRVAVKGHPDYVTLGDIVVPARDVATLDDAWEMRQAGVPGQSVLVTGPAGTAKTQFIRAWAAAKGIPYIKVDASLIRTPDDWVGKPVQDRETKTWSWRWSQFARVLQHGKPAIVHVDELNRAESVQALNALLGLLDGTGTMFVPDADESLRLPAGILVVATANIGPEFVGTLPLDGAVRQRFANGVRLGYPVEAVEVSVLTSITGIDADNAGRLVRMAAQQRVNRDDPQAYPSGAVISTRVILDIAHRVAATGTPVRDAIASTFAAQFDPGDEPALSVIIDSQFPVVLPDAGEIAEVEAEAEDKPGYWTCTTCGYALNENAKPVCDSCGANFAHPFITIGKHYFTGTPTSACTYLPASANAPCGRQPHDPVHYSATT